MRYVLLLCLITLALPQTINQAYAQALYLKSEDIKGAQPAQETPTLFLKKLDTDKSSFQLNTGLKQTTNIVKDNGLPPGFEYFSNRTIEKRMSLAQNIMQAIKTGQGQSQALMTKLEAEQNAQIVKIGATVKKTDTPTLRQKPTPEMPKVKLETVERPIETLEKAPRLFNSVE